MKISIIIPNYNHASFLQQRIESVIQQTFSDFELIILDDNSTDNSRTIIKKYVNQDDRISFYPNEKNSGSPFKQWNRGVERAKGDYIWIAESDDVAGKHFLETLLKKLQDQPSVALAFCQSNKLDSNGNVTGNWKTWTNYFDTNIFEHDFVMQGTQFIEQFLIHKNIIPNASAVIFRKHFFEQIGGADESIKNCSDWLTWLKMLMQYDVSFVAQSLNNFRYHSDSVIAKSGKFLLPDMYHDMFDRNMRMAFKQVLSNAKKDSRLKNIQLINQTYILKDVGNEGIFEVRKGKWISGWKKILRASFYPTLTTGYISRAILNR